ncbi:MAG: hypothetical protein M3N47_12065 [Chloroflexota bacterium]|nr:hypothetical protein [Chloroflexota bacterium]
MSPVGRAEPGLRHTAGAIPRPPSLDERGWAPIGFTATVTPAGGVPLFYGAISGGKMGKNWQKVGDLRGGRDRYHATRGNDQVRWRF